MRAQVGCGEHKEEAVWHRKSRGKEEEREEVVAEEREGKMRTEHFKLTQNSIVKDKSRGKTQLKGMSPNPSTAEDNTAFQACRERGLGNLHRLQSYPGLLSSTKSQQPL